MSPRKGAALFLAALIAGGTLSACQKAPVQPTSAPAAQSTPTAQASAATPAATTKPASNVNVALAAIQWPEGDVVARVNGVDIKTADWKAEVTRQLEMVTTQYQVDWNDQANINRLPQVLDPVLEEMINRELLSQLAAQEGIKITDADVQKTSDDTKQQILASGQYQDFNAFLAAYNLTQDSFDALMREQALYDRMMTAHGGPTKVEQVHAQHILVADEATAKEVKAKLDAGGDFSELAKTYSIDTSNKDNGGDLGWFPRGQMVPEFDTAAFALQPGQTSDIVKTDYGYHIIRVLERGDRDLEEPAASQYHQQQFMDWLNGERSKAKVDKLYTPPPTPTTPAEPTPAS